MKALNECRTLPASASEHDYRWKSSLRIVELVIHCLADLSSLSVTTLLDVVAQVVLCKSFDARPCCINAYLNVSAWGLIQPPNFLTFSSNSPFQATRFLA
ncbi:hypothetical protein JYB87_08345 [Shewanella avicenniae]|uniref:Uncharacterized protein n=1 Tax=Shewanella avicenniae TaxID=2814294 RepID=A0ABX7QWH8_9GAMM|nr:hypothetical protein [Shewanella avicenniae]QSX35188.1 hypothetical protein JYB87_08345 [Shewanella avicenniae]